MAKVPSPRAIDGHTGPAVVVARERAEGCPAAVACREPRCVAPILCASEGVIATRHYYFMLHCFCLVFNCQLYLPTRRLLFDVEGGRGVDGRAGRKG
jgi:hypothetical protein